MRAFKSRGSSELMLDVLFAAAVPMIISGVAMEWRRMQPVIFCYLTGWMRRGWKPKFVRRIECEKASRVGFPVEQGGLFCGDMVLIITRKMVTSSLVECFAWVSSHRRKRKV